MNDTGQSMLLMPIANYRCQRAREMTGCRDAKVVLALVSLMGLVLMAWPSLPRIPPQSSGRHLGKHQEERSFGSAGFVFGSWCDFYVRELPYVHFLVVYARD